MVTTRLVVYVSLVASAVIGVAKFVAYLATGNVAMLSQVFYSVADVGNQVLLLIGFRLSERKATRKHPFGRGKEQYFFAFVVTMLLFGVAGYASVREGVNALGTRAPEVDVTINYLVLGVALAFESYAFYKSYQGFSAERDESGFESITATFQRTKDAPLIVATTENFVAVIGVVVAIVGIYLTDRTGDATFDGIASAIIGLLLMGFALALAWENRSLLIGEGVTRPQRTAMLQAIRSVEGVAEVIDLRSMHLGPESVLVTCDVSFNADLETDDIERVVDAVEVAIRTAVPEANRIYVEAESIEEYRSAPETGSP